MILLIRFILVSIIIYLLVKSFVRYFNSQETDEKPHGHNYKSNTRNKGISKEIGEYIDYEEIENKKK